jgi:hypothetical protein
MYQEKSLKKKKKKNIRQEDSKGVIIQRSIETKCQTVVNYTAC